jgi:hypothetical protein
MDMTSQLRNDQAIMSEQFMLTQAISGLLLLNIPASWNSARLEIHFEVREDQLPGKFDIICPTPEGCDGTVRITDDIHEAARRLDAFLIEHGFKCTRAVFSARKTRFGTWSSKTDLEWEAPADSIHKDQSRR